MGCSLQKSQISNECVSEIDGSLVHQHNWVYYIFSPLGYASVFHGSWVHRFKSLKCLMSVFQKSMVHWFIRATGYTIQSRIMIMLCSHWFMGSSLQMLLYPQECVSEIHGSLVY